MENKNRQIQKARVEMKTWMKAKSYNTSTICFINYCLTLFSKNWKPVTDINFFYLNLCLYNLGLRQFVFYSMKWKFIIFRFYQGEN